MTLASRVKKLESGIDSDKDRQPMFKVTRLSPEQWKIRKAIHEAKKVLGMLTLGEIRAKAFIGTEEVRHLYEDMTRNEAKAVLDEYGDDIDFDERVPA